MAKAETKRNRAIVAKRKRGLSYLEIAKIYGLTKARIIAICKKADRWVK